MVRSFGWTVGVSSRLEHGSFLTVIGDMQLACYQHHALWRRVRMQRDGRLRGHFEENVDVVFRRVAVENGNRASFGQERRARTPLKVRITGRPPQSLLLGRRLCESKRAGKAH